MTSKERLRERYEKEFKPAYDALMKVYPFTTDDLDGEIWKSAPYCADYLVSNFGRTKSFKNGNVKIRKPALTKDGYLRVHLDKNGKRGYFGVHQLVAIVFIPNPDNKPQINHIDGCKFNNYVGNLEWATASENVQHAHDTGLAKNAQGSDDSQAKFTNEQVLYIRENPDGLTLAKLAEKFGVAFPTIAKIQLGYRYREAGGTIRKPQKYKPPIANDMRTEIRRLRNLDPKKYTYKVLCEMFGVCPQTVWNIVNS